MSEEMEIDNNNEEEQEYSPRISSSIQFTDKIIEPDMGVIKRIAKVFPGADLDGFIENFKILFRSITRDYSLGNLSLSNKKNSYDFTSFCHNQKVVMFLQDRPHLGLAMDAIMKGELLQSRSIGMKQQEIMQSQFLTKREYKSQEQSSGLIPQMKR